MYFKSDILFIVVGSAWLHLISNQTETAKFDEIVNTGTKDAKKHKFSNKIPVWIFNLCSARSKVPSIFSLWSISPTFYALVFCLKVLFLPKSFCQSQNDTRKSCEIIFRTKKVYEKRWWNLHLMATSVRYCRPTICQSGRVIYRIGAP